MKVLVILFALMAVACTAPPDQSFDSLNVNQYHSKKQLKDLVKCVTIEGPCTQLETIVRSRVPNIVVTHCGNCSLRERDIIVILTNLIAKANKADIFKMLKLADPKGKKSKNYLKFLNSVSKQRGLPKLSDDIINALPDSS